MLWIISRLPYLPSYVVGGETRRYLSRSLTRDPHVNIRVLSRDSAATRQLHGHTFKSSHYRAAEPGGAADDSGLPSVVMLREATVEPRQEPRQEILRAAARLFQQQGYDATSMNDVAAALKLSKGGLYHHFQSKDEILFHIMSHAMDITEQRVINAARRVEDPEERLRTLIRLHIGVVLSEEDREVTVMLHENHPLPPALRRKINARKKDYVHFVENLVADVQRKRGTAGTVTPRAAAFALLGLINWIYQWYKPGGELTGEALTRQFTEIFFRGAV
jgi:TetR/AcrR family transcriptional regulator, cholesterol catabolism regulator